jgi:mono/diheme cytochrome c family protein
MVLGRRGQRRGTRQEDRMKGLFTGFVLGALATVLLACAGIYAYFARGMAPVATSAPPMPFEKRLARMALHARMEREMPAEAPIPPDEGNLSAGARVYLQHCAVCHGLPGSRPTAIAEGEFPKPPHLFRGKGVTDDSAGETYWKVANGIRLTGMPGFEKSLSSVQMWQVSLLLANAGKLPDSARAALAGGAEAPKGAGPGTDAGTAAQAK